MTEEEAKTKWCPFARAQQFQPVHNVLAASGEPLSDNPAVNRESWNVNCIGSACMAWRQEHPRESREDHSGAPGMMAKRAVETNRIVRREGGPGCLGHLVLDATGFCGLAGEP